MLDPFSLCRIVGAGAEGTPPSWSPSLAPPTFPPPPPPSVVPIRHLTTHGILLHGSLSMSGQTILEGR